MKGIHQIYLFATAVLFAAFYFIQRGYTKEGSLFEVSNDGRVDWQVHDFGEVLFGRDSLPWEEMQEVYWPFTVNQPERFFWANERKNQMLIDHYTNVKNLFNQRKVTENLARISANANQLLEVAVPNKLFYYISGIDIENPCLYFPGGRDSVIAFVGLDNFLGAGYPGYNAIPGYQRVVMEERQLGVSYANALVENCILKNFNDPSLLGQMVYHGKRHLAVEAVISDVAAYEVLGYSIEEYNFLVENERQIWEVLVREKLLFSADMMVRQRLVEPAPFSKMGTAMDSEIPGRVAQFIGYRMMRALANNSGLALEEILKIRDAQRILRDAQYKP
ncbi:MAG TPA: hypothetical protein DIT65_01135 [Cryomorphaceae bacterium]|nr:hypothetical protein [Cryomorphaceae bacterium]